MPRYINKDILLHKLQERCDKLSEQYGTEDDYTRGYGAAIDAIDIIALKETADVQEVRHGKWRYKLLDNFKKVECTCTHCGWRGVDNYDSYVDISDFEYCPNCGAKMDE